MSKTWDTKRQIFKILRERQHNATEIAEALGMAPSTISQHLSELKRIGAIEEIENSYVKKWKYYKANPNFDFNMLPRSTSIMANIGKAAALIAVVAAIGLVMLALSLNGAGASRQDLSSVIFSLTDPPQVPTGTNALIMSYSSVQAHIVPGSGTSNGVVTGWINATGSGTLDLMGLVNTSEVIGNASIPSNSLITEVRFTVTSADIVINGTTYNVTMPGNEKVITAHITSGHRLNGTAQTLIDLTPTIITIYTNNSTEFVMVPSVRAVLIGSAPVSSHIGTKSSLNETENQSLEHAKPSISITAEMLSVANNSTSFSVTVKNMGNSSVTLHHVMLRGNLSVAISPTSMGKGFAKRVEVASVKTASGQSFIAPLQNVTATHDTNDSLSDGHDGVTASVNLTVGIGSGNGHAQSGNSDRTGTATHGGNVTARDNQTTARTNGNSDKHGNYNMTAIVQEGEAHHVEVRVNAGINGTPGFNRTLGDEVAVGISAEKMRALNFIITANGALVLPFSSGELESNGFTIAPNATATFTYSGPIILGNGHLSLAPVAGDTYGINVQGEEDASAYANVTAG